MLQLVLGRAGYGKTEYVFSSIKTLVEKKDENIVLITPEQYSFIAERRLLSELGESKVSNVYNGSFSRLSNEIINLYGGNELPVLSNGAKAVMMKKALQSVQDNLRLFSKKNLSSNSFISSVVSIYDEMKSCRVSCDDIMDAAENTDRQSLRDKLIDISAIIGAYDTLIASKYYDPANELTRLYEKLLTVDYFKNKTVFIDGFSGFVAQEYKIIEVIIRQAKNVYITLCSDSVFNHDKYDLFSYVNMNIDIIRGLAKKADVPFAVPLILKENFRAENSELKMLEKNFCAGIVPENETVPKHIRLYSAKNITDECDRVSENIMELLRDGVRASEISVICRDMDKYKKELEFSFRKYNVPYFNDERQSVCSQPLIMMVNFLLRTVIYSFRAEDIFSFLKTGLTCVSDDEIAEFENYVYVWNINGSRFHQPFTGSTKGFAQTITENDRVKIDRLESIRQAVIFPISKFAKQCKSGTSADISRGVYNTLIALSADKKLCELAKELDRHSKSALAREQGRIWDLLMEILNKLAVIGESEEIDIKDYYKLFNLMIANEDLGVIPAGLDNVQLGSAERIRCDNPKAVFVVGANEGEFPKNIVATGLLSDSDRNALVENNFKLYSYGKALNAQEKYFAYMALSSAKEKLYVSYIAGDGGVESSLVTQIRSVFPAVITETYNEELSVSALQSEDNAFELMSADFEKNTDFSESLKQYFSENEDYRARYSSVKSIYENNEINVDSKELATDLFKKDMYLSASGIEDYFSCPFRYFCKYGLGARILKRAEMDYMQTGTVIHYVLEKIILEVTSKKLPTLSYGDISVLVHKYLSEYLENNMGNTQDLSSRFKYQFLRLSKLLVSVVSRLKEEFEQSDFEAKAFELKIGNDEEVKSKIIDLPDGGSVSIRGAIDRVDFFENNGKKYVRVVDYKSGSKKFLLSDILYGLNLQMFIYLFTVSQSESAYSGIPSGVLYMHSKCQIFSLDRKADEKEVEKKENTDFRMLGIVLNDEENEIACHMEHDLKGKYIPAKMTAKNVWSGGVVSLEDFNRISLHIDTLLMQMAENLHNGRISQFPVNGKNHDSTCDFCDYGDVCMNRKGISVREIEDMSEERVLSRLRENDK